MKRSTRIITTLAMALVLASALLVLCACGKDKTTSVSLSFVANGGSAVATVVVDEGTSVPCPADPTREGNRFLGWYQDAGLTESVTWPLVLTHDLTLYAAWEANEKARVTLTFATHGGSAVAAVTVNEGTSVPAPVNPTYEGHEFLGWYLDETLKTSVTWPLVMTASLTIHASWKEDDPTQCTLSFVTNGGNTLAPVVVEKGSSVAAPTAPTYEGHRFTGWCSDKALTKAVTWPLTVSASLTLYASWTVVADMSQYLSSLLDGYELNPLSYIPEALRPGASANLVSATTSAPDYTTAVTLSSIKNQGCGEEWHMILDNLEQSQLFFNALSVVESLASASILAFNNYLDKNPASTASYAFASGIYQVTINFDGTMLYYLLDYTATFPGLGSQKAQIALGMNVTTQEKTVRIQLGDANALTYTILGDSYTFAIKYLGVRRAYFTIARKESGDIEGHISEYLTVKSVEIASAADFYITDTYASAVGSKASGLVGFKGYISELYDVKTGKLLSYEVQETLSSITYHTLWFDFTNVAGITSLRHVEDDPSTDASEEAFYVNGSSAPWASLNVGGLSLKALSRRFDIEFRTQYFYAYDSEDKTYTTVSLQVPMLFVQEEQLATFTTDVTKANAGINASITLSSTLLTKVESDHETLVPTFIANKNTITVDAIIAYIGDAISFS